MAGGFAARADERTDHFLPPTGEEGNLTSATLLAPAPEGDFIFSARVEVEFAAAFDAGTLLLFFDSARWAKLCFEATPEVSPSDRKSTRLNSSHVAISYAVFCLKKKTMI